MLLFEALPLLLGAGANNGLCGSKKLQTMAAMLKSGRRKERRTKARNFFKAKFRFAKTH